MLAPGVVVLAPPAVAPTDGIPVAGFIPVVVVPGPVVAPGVEPGAVVPVLGIPAVVELHGPATVLMVDPVPVTPVEAGGPIGVGAGSGAAPVTPGEVDCPGTVV